MRRTRAAVALTAAGVAAGAAAGVATPAPATAAPPGVATYAAVPAQVFGDVAVGMPTKRTVKIQHRDPITGAWDAPTTLYRATGKTTCGDIEGQSSPGGVALLLQCDTPYFEENPPVRAVAMVSGDGYTWSAGRLRGEAYRPPAVAPSGAYAAWLVGGTGTFVLWSASTGFAAPAGTGLGGDSGGETLVVDDAGTVSVLGPKSQGRRCVIEVHTRDLAGQQTSSVVDGVDPGCTEGDLRNVDALTVTGGGYDTAHRFTITRADTASPWLLTRPAPADAAGLVSYDRPRRQLATTFLETSDPSEPLVALGGPDRRRVLAQRFDATTQTWGPQVPVHTADRRCRIGDDYSFAPRAVYVLELDCGRRTTVLASSDATTWTVADVGRRAWTYAGGRLALPDAGGTTLVSPDGVQRFAVTTGGRCDVIRPGVGAQLVRLHGGAWPRRVQVSTGGRFSTVSRARPVADRCRRVLVDNSADEPVVVLQGVRRDRVGRFTLRAGTWRFGYGGF